MSKQYSIAQAKDRLPRLVHEVERGSRVELTRRGKPVAAIVSIQDYQRLPKEQGDLWQAIQEFRNSPDFEPIDVDEFLEGIRDKSPGRDFEW